MSTIPRYNNAPPPSPSGDGPKFRRRDKRQSFGPPKPKVEPFEQCNSELFAKLESVKRIGALRQSLAPTDGSSEFEILEFYGDSVLYERISFFLMQTRRFMSPHLLTRMRMSVINNRNLANVYDVLGLQNLISSPETVNVVKSKADVVEAIVGELSESAYRSAGGTAALVRTVLDELLAYVCYLGEQTYFAEESREKAAEASKAHGHAPQPSVAPVRMLSATPAIAAASSSANPLPPPPPALEPVQSSPAPAASTLSPSASVSTVPVTPAPRQPEGRRTPRRPRSRSGSSNASASSPSPSPPRRAASPALPPPPPPPVLPVAVEEPAVQFQRMTLGGREVREYRV